MKDLTTLLDLKNFLYDKAEHLWWASLFINIISQIGILAAIIVDNMSLLYLIGFIAIIAPIASVWIREYAASETQRADKIRRLILYADSLGESIPEKELADIRLWRDGKKLGSAPFDPPYYNSKCPIGPTRLADNTAESAFFTTFLSNKAYRNLFIVVLISVFILLSILYLVLYPNMPQNTKSTIVRVVLVVLSFILGSDILLLVRKYYKLHTDSGQSFNKCVNLLKEPDPNLLQVMQAVEGYHLCLIQSPPIPLKLHKKYNSFLNESYRNSHKC